MPRLCCSFGGCARLFTQACAWLACSSLVALASLVSLVSLVSGCKQQDAAPFSFYDQRIAPIVDVGCQRQTTGCHQDDGHGFALGNLDLSSYDSLMRRHDVLRPYGPYPVGVLLLKAGNSVNVDVRTIDPPDATKPTELHVRVRTDIRHGGGEGALAQGSRDYSIVKQWIDGGYARNGVPTVHLNTSQGACVHGVGNLPGIDLAKPVSDSTSYERFVKQIQPALEQRCAGSSCHGSPLADLYLTCGSNAEESRWNYEVAVRHLRDTAALSELLRKPLAKNAGGVFHEGGDIFANVDDPDYRTILAWAEDVEKRAPELLQFGDADPGLRFFANRVEPVLVRKGCMLQNCHSSGMFHDLRLRGGSEGWFSSIAMRRNYDMSRLMLSIDSPDPNQSRLIAKNLCSSAIGGHGVQHRGGVLLEDFGGCASDMTQAGPEQCVGVDADHGDLDTVPAYCVLARWHAIERAQALQRGDLPSLELPSAVVFVTRPAGTGGVLDFDTFRPGADLVRAGATFAADGTVELGMASSLIAGCGLGASFDVRGVSVSWDAKHIAFAARKAADAPLRIYEMNADGSHCGPLEDLQPKSASEQGIQLHDFDPAYAPDGRLVFASTRGNLDGQTTLRGPSRTPASLAPNANLYVYDSAATPPVRQLTYLSNQEVAPSFMTDGRVIFTAEKRARDFHQLAARRQNLDGGDYHPLFAQRSSVGFDSATEVIELPNRNFALVAAPLAAADGGGSIVIINRSIGPDQKDRDPSDKAFIHSLTTPVPGAFGGDSGVFRSPAPLPTGKLLAACDLMASDLSQGSRHYGLCELDARGGTPRLLWQDAQRVAQNPVAIWPRFARPVFVSRRDESNGSTHIEQGQQDATVHYTDLPMLATLLFSNTRIGRPIPFDFTTLQVFESRPAPASASSFGGTGALAIDDKYGTFYEDLHSLGKHELENDGSLFVRVPGGMPLMLGLAGSDAKLLTFGKGAPFTGPMRQREETQFYPGERAKQSMPRQLFDGLCAGCHGSLTGRELDSVVNVDVLTSASKTLAGDAPVDLR